MPSMAETSVALSPLSFDKQKGNKMEEWQFVQQMILNDFESGTFHTHTHKTKIEIKRVNAKQWKS